MNEIEQRLALVPVAADVDMAKQLLVHESVAAKVLKISVREFRRLVDSSVIPCRLYGGRMKRLCFLEDLRLFDILQSAHLGCDSRQTAVITLLQTITPALFPRIISRRALSSTLDS